MPGAIPSSYSHICNGMRKLIVGCRSGFIGSNGTAVDVGLEPAEVIVNSVAQAVERVPVRVFPVDRVAACVRVQVGVPSENGR
jgi:hypothetical protein